MWNEFKIGRGYYGNTAISVHSMSKNDIDISENDVSYWITYKTFGIVIISGIIMKDTPEGKRLTEIKNTKEDAHSKSNETVNYLVPILFKYIDVNIFKSILKQIADSSYRNGRADKASEIRSALGYY